MTGNRTLQLNTRPYALEHLPHEAGYLEVVAQESPDAPGGKIIFLEPVEDVYAVAHARLPEWQACYPEGLSYFAQTNAERTLRGAVPHGD